MFLTQRSDYDQDISRAYQCFAWNAVTLSLQDPLFLVLIRGNHERDGADLSICERKIFSSPADVIAITQKHGNSLLDLDPILLCPQWLSKAPESWKTFELNAIWEAISEKGHIGWRYDSRNGETLFEIFGAENPESLQWIKVA